MFYSHTFLARKGPLGTVWCAAHLQHRLKKSQYVSTNIPSTVERIIDSEVPIALRMSAHLLLGVVRIYSKQVDYLREDCNVVLTTINRVFTAAAAAVNLPEDANHAPFHSITMPQRFELDAMDLDDYSRDWGEDVHIGNQEDITMAEQIPTGRDPYVAITLDENDLSRSSFVEDNSGPIPMQIDEESIPSVEKARHVLRKTDTPGLPDRAGRQSNEDMNNDENIASIASKGTELQEKNPPSSPNPLDQDSAGHIDILNFSADHRSPEKKLKSSPTPKGTPSVEMFKIGICNSPATVLSNVAEPDNDLVEQLEKDSNRDKDKDIVSSVENFRNGIGNSSANILPDEVEPDKDLEEQVNKDSKKRNYKDIASSVVEETVPSSSDNPQEQDSSGHINSVNLPRGSNKADRSLEIRLQASPPVAQPNVRKRKTKHASFDAITVLSNNHMKNALEDTQGLLRDRTKPTSLEVWRVNKRLRKNDAFFEPFLTGTCEELQDIYKEDFISSKPHLIIAEADHQETNDVQPSPVKSAEDPTSCEVQPNEIPPEDTFMPDLITTEAENQPNNNNNDNEIPPEDPGSCEVQLENNENGAECISTPSLYVVPGSSIGKSNSTPETHPSFETGGGGSTGHWGSEIETPNIERTNLSDIPELTGSASDLDFLDQEDNSPDVSQATPQLVSCSTNKGTSGFFSGSTNKGTSGLETLSSRTRAVAQYLKNQSFVSPIAENSEQTGDLSLNKILEGKSSKVCARMFYETLVLKSYDRIDLHQEEPYDDIKLKVIF